MVSDGKLKKRMLQFGWDIYPNRMDENNENPDYLEAEKSFKILDEAKKDLIYMSIIGPVLIRSDDDHIIIKKKDFEEWFGDTE